MQSVGTSLTLPPKFLIKDGFRPDVGRYVGATVMLENGQILCILALAEHLITGLSLFFKDLKSSTSYPDSQIVMWRYATDEEAEYYENQYD
jgi:hypothetical protein